MKLVKKEQLEQSYERYDLEVEDSHNFIAEGIVVHNSNSRFVYSDGAFHCGSRTEWKRQYADYSHVTKELLLNGGCSEEKALEILDRLHNKPKVENMWWRLLNENENLQCYLKAHEGYTLYGEVYGQVQDLRYGTQNNEIRLAVFDVMNQEAEWFSYDDMKFSVDLYGVTRVPELYRGPYIKEKILSLADGPSMIPGANHIREGCVVRPIKERYHPHHGRCVLKLVSADYLERSK